MLSTVVVDCRSSRRTSRREPCAARGRLDPSGHNRATSRTPLRAERALPLFSIIQAAGWPIWPLILCSIVALALVIERLLSLRAARVAPPRLLDEVISVARSSLTSTDVVKRLAEN